MKAFYWFLARCFLFYASTFLILTFYINYTSIGKLFYVRRYIEEIYVLVCGMAILFSHWMLRRLRSHLREAAILDNPNNRSMHAIPVPRGAGWAFVIPLLCYFLLTATVTFSEISVRHAFSSYCIFSSCKPFLSLGIFFGLLLLTCVCWLDDRKGLSATWRLLAQFYSVIMALSVFVVPRLDDSYGFALEGYFQYLPSGFPIGIALIAILIAWIGFMNLYNFMDGIDGITAIETMSLGIGILFTYIYLLLSHGTQITEIVPVRIMLSIIILIVCSTVLLFHNWHPAKIFLGDVGSVPIGYLMGFFLLVIISAGFWYVALTLPLYYLADGGITLARRILRGEKFWEAHRTHFYQRAAQAAGRHDVVVLNIAACNLVLIVIAMLELLVSPWFVLAAPLPVALLLHNMAHQRHIGVKSPNG